jgi:hypothetical protein
MRIHNPIITPNSTQYGGPAVTHAVTLVYTKKVLTQELWHEAHTKEEPTQEWWDDWLSRVPNVTCDCRAWVMRWIELNPIDWDDFHSWIVDLHNAVNEKLGKPNYEYRYRLGYWSYTSTMISIQY